MNLLRNSLVWIDNYQVDLLTNLEARGLRSAATDIRVCSTFKKKVAGSCSSLD